MNFLITKDKRQKAAMSTNLLENLLKAASK